MSIIFEEYAMSCPDCGAPYPVYKSPGGQEGAVCDACGYATANYTPPEERESDEPQVPD